MSQPAKRGRTAWSPPEGVKIDWTRPALHIAKECGVAVTTVINWMRRNGLPIGPRGTPPGTTWVRTNRLDPASLDWTRQDIALAKIHGVCRERIRQLRKAAGLPASGSAEWLAAGGVVTHPPHQGRRKAPERLAEVVAEAILKTSNERLQAIWEEGIALAKQKALDAQPGSA